MMLAKQNARQGSDEWLVSRIGRITGSRIGAIAGVNKYMTRRACLKEMRQEIATGEPKRVYQNHHMKRGVEWEAAALNKLAEQLDLSMLEFGLQEYWCDDRYGFSPDGIIPKKVIGGNSPILVEVKIPEKPVNEIDAPINEAHLAQMQWGMHLLDIDTAMYVECGVTNDAILHIARQVEIRRDKKRGHQLEKLADEALEELAHDLEQVEGFEFFVDALLELRQQEKTLGASIKEMTDTLKDALGEDEGETILAGSDGHTATVVRIERMGSVDNKAVAEALRGKGIDIESFRGAPTRYIKVTLD